MTIYDQLQNYYNKNKESLGEFRKRVQGMRSSQVNGLLGFLERPIDIRVKLIEDGEMPSKGTEDSAAYDAYVREITNEEFYVKVKLGFATEIPKGYEAVVIARSSITDHGWQLSNGIGLIDSDYRQEWEARFNPSPLNKVSAAFPYKIGDRCAQFMIRKKVNTVLDNALILTPSKRKGGFGSTGK